MKTNESIPADARDEVIELGVASIETKGNAGMRIEPLGFVETLGISEG